MPTGRIQVAPGQTIVSAGWGNPLWDHSVQAFASAADRDNQFPAPQPGAMSFTEDTKTLWVFVSGAWVPVPTGMRIVWGSVAVPIATANTAASAAVTFPAGSFTAAPFIVAGISTGPPAAGSAFAWPSAGTASGFTMNAMRSNTSTQTCWYIAIGA
ncbi:MAG TPA: hypothetical protein VH912_21935 [Streptosporangiaceae bacterium]|jgi:hypothetical protein